MVAARKKRWQQPALVEHDQQKTKNLLNLAFLVIDVLARDGIIFLHDHFLGLGAGILLGHVEMTRIRRRVQPDLDRVDLRHRLSPEIGSAPQGHEEAAKFISHGGAAARVAVLIEII
jgi:hypothetical protein